MRQSGVILPEVGITLLSCYLEAIMFPNYGLNISCIKYSCHLLPPPFETMCRDYSSYEFESQGHFFESCVVRKYMKQHKRFPLFLCSAYESLSIPVTTQWNTDVVNNLYIFVMRLPSFEKRRKDCMTARTLSLWFRRREY